MSKDTEDAQENKTQLNQNEKKEVKTFRKIYPQIYSFTLPTFHENDGWQKVGYTERYDADDRIKEEVQTAAIKLPYDKLWSASSVYPDGHSFFNDKKLHAFYRQNEIPQSKKQDAGGLGEEWFYFGNEPGKSKKLFDDFRHGKYEALKNSVVEQYILRAEQEDAVSQTLAYAQNNQTTDFANPNEDADFLWNAKPRFGKTLASYDFAKRFGAKKVLIITNRPSIANSWYDDYKKFIDGYYFISTTDSLKDRSTMSRDEFIRRANPSHEDKQITFLSLQDLKGGKRFGGKFDKLEWVADLVWDLVIFDESHEASDTDKTLDALEKIKRRFTLYLSGTPFKALENGRFHKEQIYNWTYLDEQKMKEYELNHGDEYGAHTNLPDMRLFTYKMSDMIADRLDEGVDIGEENYDYAFDLNEMFATDKNGRFIHEKEVNTFLNELTSNEKYPFSTPELRNELRHTFWLVGNRVASAKAMARLLRRHPVFEQYHIILAAGDGKIDSNLDYLDDSDEEMDNVAENENAFNRVKKAIKNYDKTITLSVGQLTTGVTVKEWSAVLMLSDIKSESLYMQAIFRSQNPCEFSEERSDGELSFYRKKSAYVFDFSPNRVLQVYDKFANGLQAEAVTGEVTGDERERYIAELLNYFPVLAEDKNGEMIELDAKKVLTYPKAIVAREVVNRGFVTNLLFANVDHVFNIPSELVETLKKAKSTNDSGREKVKAETISHDSKRDQKCEHRISVNTGRMLGNKVYGDAVLEIVEDALSESVNNQGNFVDTLVDKFGDLIEEPLAVYKETYAPTAKEYEETRKKEVEKAIGIVKEYVSKDIQDATVKTELASKLADIVETDLPKDTVQRKEEENRDKEDKTELDQIRAKLRTFTRAIPSFIMAAKNVGEITIDNIENTVSDKEFQEIFTETDSETPFTKEDFRKLRDPGVYHEPDGREVHFDGFFDRYVFNAAIREFEEKRQELADYLQPNTTEDIFSYVRPLKTNQIFTPRRVVNMMLDLLEENNPGIFANPNLTFADLYVKSGLYLTEIAKRLNRGLANIIPDREERIKHIFERQLYGFAPTGIIYNIAHKYIYGNFTNISDRNFIQKDLTETFKNNQELNMKFDVIVGNPPYQEATKDTRDKPVYNLFMESAYSSAKKVCLITPARFLSNAGATPKEWNDKMLNDEHLKIVFFTQKSADVFNNTDIKGGVVITYRDSDTVFGKIGIFTPFNELNTLLRKVVNDDFIGLNNIVGVQLDYKFRKEYDISQEGLKTNVFKMQEHLFTSTRQNEEQIQVLGLMGRDRVYRFIDKKYLDLPKNHDKWKVYLPTSNGSGALGEVLSTPLIGQPLIGQPLIGHTETFIGIGEFTSQNEAENCLKYIKTKFARVMLGVLKTTQHNLANTWRYVPLQDFTPSSDIDWSKSIHEIDLQLYKKYGLSDEEINFIETRVREME